MDRKKLIAHLQSREAAESIAGVLLCRIGCHITAALNIRPPGPHDGPRDFAHESFEPNEFWRVEPAGLFTKISATIGGCAIAAYFVPSAGRVEVSDLGDAMRNARECLGELEPLKHFRKVPQTYWDRMGRQSGEKGFSSDDGITVEINIENGLLLATRCEPYRRDYSPMWTDLQRAVCAVMLAQLRILEQVERAQGIGTTIADELIATAESPSP